MAETDKPTPARGPHDPAARPRSSGPRPPLHKIYALPLPVRTFPLPSFYPSNPISWLHVAYAWLKCTLCPPAAEPSVVHVGLWSPETRSVHITDPKSMRALWEQGFFGKGSLSRSEPNWLRREAARRSSAGHAEKITSEMRTIQRRQERERVKWERSRAEQEAIDRLRQAETSQAARQEDGKSTGRQGAHQHSKASANGHLNGHSKDVVPCPPVGPLQLLALPNSEADLRSMALMNWSGPDADPLASKLPNGAREPPEHLEASILPLPMEAIAAVTNGGQEQANGTGDHSTEPREEVDRMMEDAAEPDPVPLKRTKSVRFSSTVESTTFQRSDPPSPYRKPLAKPVTAADSNGRATSPGQCNGSATHGPIGKHPGWVLDNRPAPKDISVAVADEVIPDKEHLQLSAEEAFFLVFTIGSLRVLNPQTAAEFTTEQLFTLFRQHSSFPMSQELTPADSFLVQYAVYHHFRSLGWVPRHGTKFGVDWLLYNRYAWQASALGHAPLANFHLRGPVFDHAGFGVIVLPTFSDPWWKEHGHDEATTARSWRWFHGLNRVLSSVYKRMVLVYVDVPPPPAIADNQEGIVGILSRYRIREILIRRWSGNRNR